MGDRGGLRGIEEDGGSRGAEGGIEKALTLRFCSLARWAISAMSSTVFPGGDGPRQSRLRGN